MNRTKEQWAGMNCTANLLSEAQADIAELWAKVASCDRSR